MMKALIWLIAFVSFGVGANHETVPSALLEGKIIHYRGVCYVARTGLIAKDEYEAYQQKFCIAGQKKGEDYVTIIVEEQNGEVARIIFLKGDKQEIKWQHDWKGA